MFDRFDRMYDLISAFSSWKLFLFFYFLMFAERPDFDSTVFSLERAALYKRGVTFLF